MRIDEINGGDVTEAMRLEEKKLKIEMYDLWHQEELYWLQRSRIRWLKEGDRNSKFFHISTIQRRKRNLIAKIQNDSGVWLTLEEAIRKEATKFFTKLYQAEQNMVS